MRATRLLLGLATSFAVVACVASGCSSGSTAAPPADSGAAQDVTTDVEVEAAVEAAAEAAPEAAPADAGCVPDGSINGLAVPDGSAACVSCFETQANCAPIITACNTSCTCVAAFQQFEGCISAGGSLLSCAATDLTNALPASDMMELYACGLTCATACGYTAGDSGGPKGDSATGDGATE